MTTRNLLPAVVTVLALLAPAGLARAQAQQTLGDQREIMVDVKLRGLNRRVLLDTLAVWTALSQSPSKALADARAVLDSLEIPISRSDTLARVIYNNQLARTRPLVASERMSSLLRCGWGMNGDHADSWRVSLGYAVFVKPAPGGGSRLGVAIAGSATDVEGASKPAVQCASTGRFEQLIASLIAQRGR